MAIKRRIVNRPDIIMRFIDASLYLNGEVSRGLIKEVFRISSSTATDAIKQYRDTVSNELIYTGYEQNWITRSGWKKNDDFWKSENPVNYLKAIKVVFGTTAPLAPRELK